MIDLIFRQAFKRDSGALQLVIANVKPCAFITFKFNQDISKLEYKKIKYSDNVAFFILPQSKGYINLMIFNIKLIDRKINQINKLQSSYFFKDVESLITHYIKVYKNKEKLRERLGIQKHSDLNLIQGIIFGFPLKNIKIFYEEIKSREFEKGRKFYSTSLSRSLVFVGYPSTKKESENLIKKWEKALRKLKTH